MKNGKLKLGKYAIEPTTSIDMLQSDEFNVIKTKNGIVYISKKPLELCGSNFWTTIYFGEINIKKVEFCYSFWVTMLSVQMTLTNNKIRVI